MLAWAEPVVLKKLLGGEREPFLVLSEENSTKAEISPPAPAPSKPAKSEPKPAAAPVATAAKPAAAPKAEPAAKAPDKPLAELTTAELLAAERASQQTSAPVRSTETFAAELMNPAKALPRRRRRPGAALAGFKAMVGTLQR